MRDDITLGTVINATRKSYAIDISVDVPLKIKYIAYFQSKSKSKRLSEPSCCCSLDMKWLLLLTAQGSPIVCKEDCQVYQATAGAGDGDKVYGCVKPYFSE